LTAEERWDVLEKELAEIRIALSFPQSPRFVKLKGLWKGLRVSEDDLAEANRSIFTVLPSRLFHVTVAREKNLKRNVSIMGFIRRSRTERGVTGMIYPETHIAWEPLFYHR
jgi:hypothetical protein